MRIAVPISNVIASPMPKVTSFDCATIVFIILSLNDISPLPSQRNTNICVIIKTYYHRIYSLNFT